jgi:hypothetical protein
LRETLAYPLFVDREGVGDRRPASICRRIIGPRSDRSRVVENSSVIDEIAVLWRSAVRIRNSAGLLYFARRRIEFGAGFAQENIRGAIGWSPGLLPKACSLYAKHEQAVN